MSTFHPRLRHRMVSAALAGATTLLLFTPALAAPNDIGPVIDNVRNWLTGLLAALATLFLVVGGIRYLTAMGNQRAIEQGKEGVKSAVIGYALAVLAPVLVEILKRIVGV